MGEKIGWRRFREDLHGSTGAFPLWVIMKSTWATLSMTRDCC